MPSALADTPRVPSTLFETTSFLARDQFDAWRERISVVFDVDTLEMPSSAGFLAMALGFHLGDLVLTRTRFEGQRFARSAARARADNLDHYLVQLYTEGGYTGVVDDNEIKIRAGSVSILDLARPTRTRASAAECISLVVPRDTLDPLLPRRVNLHGVVLDSGNSRLFSSYLLSLLRQLPTTELSQAPHIARATCSLLAACLMPKLDELPRSVEATHRDPSISIQSRPRSKVDLSEKDNFDDWIRMLRA